MRSMLPRRLAAGAALVLLAGAAAAQGRDARLFEVPFLGFDASEYSTARYPHAACVADLDNDGDADVAAVSFVGIARLTVLANLGAGLLDAPDVYALPQPSSEVIGADFDGDGDVDLVAANTGYNPLGTGVSYFANRGDATFLPARTFATGSGPIGLAAADFDGDGDIDLAVADRGWLGQGTTVSLLQNHSEVGELFAPPRPFEAGEGPYRLAAADINGDGAVDLAVANGVSAGGGTARVNVLINDGNGGFAPPIQLPVSLAFASFFPTVITADTDLDGDQDLLYADAKLNGVVLLQNRGAEGFAPEVKLAAPFVAGGPSALAAGDVTGDGWPDVIGTQHSSGGWVVWPSAGGGAFGMPERHVAAETPYDVELADIEGDGDLDPILLGLHSLEVTVHFNPGDGAFGPRAIVPMSRGGAFFFDQGDVDGDGDLDVVNAATPSFQILRNRGDGTFAPLETFRPPTVPLDVKLRDLDGDGDLDLLWNERNPPYRWGSALNGGGGAFANATIWPVATCGYFRSEIDAFDFDGDGDLDVVQIESLGCPPVTGGRIFISRNTGGGQFTLAGVIQANPNPRSVAGGDFDRDGNVDLAISSQPTTILLGNGDLTFTKINAGAVPGINIAADDLDQDGNLDLAIALQRNVAPFIESMAVQLGHGDGSFQPPVIYLGSHSPNLAQISEIVVGDADRDGILDVMCMNYASNDVSLWLGNGDGTFQRQIRYGAGQSSLDLAFADFTGDGIADLATYHLGFAPQPGGLTIFRGIEDVPRCQPNAGFHGPGAAFVSVCGQPLSAGSSAGLLLVHAPPGAPAFVGAALTPNPIPLLGGTWVPNPTALLVALVADPSGQVALPVPGGGGPVELFVQLGYLDPTVGLGVGLTNAVRIQLLP